MSVIDDMNQVFCANVYDEARRIAADGFPWHQRDLFMEQGTRTFLCIAHEIRLYEACSVCIIPASLLRLVSIAASQPWQCSIVRFIDSFLCMYYFVSDCTLHACVLCSIVTR